MKKVVIFAVGALIGCSLSSVFAQQIASFPDESDLFLTVATGKRVDLADSLDMVRCTLGPPLRTSIREDLYHVGIEYVVLEYDAISVVFFDDNETMLGIWVGSPDACSSRGIKVGDSEKKILDSYGSPTFRSERRISYAVPVRELGLTASLAFEIDGGVATQMSISVAW